MPRVIERLSSLKRRQWTKCEVWTRMAAPLRESERVWQFWFGSAPVSDLFRTRWFPAEGKKEQQAAADAEVNAQFADTLAAAVAGELHAATALSQAPLPSILPSVTTWLRSHCTMRASYRQLGRLAKHAHDVCLSRRHP